MVLLMTDSPSPEEPAEVRAAADALHALAEVYVVGLGSDVDPAQVAQVASSPWDVHAAFLSMDQIATLTGIATWIQRIACP